MKYLIIITLALFSTSASAAQYSGKKFKMTITKTPEGKTVEGEVWDTTKSEHIFLITPKTVTPTENTTVKTNPETGALEFK